MKKYVILIILLTFVSSCKEDATSPGQTSDELTGSGWSEYESGNYQNALSSFNKAIEKDTSFTEAYNGAGWANAKLSNLDDAYASFNNCLRYSSQHLDAKAGLAFVLNAQKHYSSAITRAIEVLTASPNWIFAHNSTIDASDLHLIIAESYFALANYSSSLSEVKKLNPAFNADITTQAGIAALASEIERLVAIYL
jgi:tetratricopeptide (TPR) repeat protein